MSSPVLTWTLSQCWIVGVENPGPELSILLVPCPASIRVSFSFQAPVTIVDFACDFDNYSDDPGSVINFFAQARAAVRLNTMKNMDGEVWSQWVWE